MVARSVSTARSASLLNSRSDCPAPSARQSQRRRHECQHPGHGREPDVADLFWQWLRGETANSPLDRMTASAKTVWKRLYGAQVKRICASTLAWSCDLLTGPKILESRLLPRLSPATKYIPSGTTTCFKSPRSRQAIVGSESLTS